jgi:hypothetical protein
MWTACAIVVLIFATDRGHVLCLDAAILAFYGLMPRANKEVMMIFGDDRAWRLLTLVLLLPVIAPFGCAGPNISTGRPYAGMTCVDDSAECINRRQTTLRYLENDKERAWIKQKPPPAAYASGVRLFAFKKKTKELTCNELALGRREADKAPAILRGPAGANLTTAQVSRGVILASEVSRELTREMRRRCRS